MMKDMENYMTKSINKRCPVYGIYLVYIAMCVFLYKKKKKERGAREDEKKKNEPLL